MSVVVVADDKNKSEDVEEEPDVNAAHKEKSVLQAKLTKLAIQIGYVGQYRSLPIYVSLHMKFLKLGLSHSQYVYANAAGCASSPTSGQFYRD